MHLTFHRLALVCVVVGYVVWCHIIVSAQIMTMVIVVYILCLAVTVGLVITRMLLILAVER